MPVYFNHSNSVVKQNFSKKDSRTLILATRYSTTQSYFKIDLIFTAIFNVENHEPLGSVITNCL